MHIKRKFYSSLALTAVLALVGCDKGSKEAAAPTSTPVATSAEHGHEDWWCSEHGLPEEICAQCSKEVAANLKAKGDWCSKHDRPNSQCFICHPEKEAEFAALYEAKYGKKPPKPELGSEGETKRL